MRNYAKELRKAVNLISRKKYTPAIRYLEPKVPIYLEDDGFYYLLGLALYYTGDMGGARFYFERGLLANRNNQDIKLMLALTHLKRKDSAEAAKAWLSILEAHPENKRASRGLEILRRIDNEKDLNAFIDGGRHKRLMPPFKKPPLWPWAAGLVTLGVLAAAALFFIPRISLPEREPSREELNYLDMDISGIPVSNPAGTFHYVLTVDEIRKSYNRAVELFDKSRDNECQVEINRINNSNASGDLKKRVSQLEGYLEKPDYTAFPTDYTYAQVQKDPLLYENCWVLWKGRLTNLDIGEERISFLFLVGFENETFLEGSIPAYIEYGVKIDQELPVEIMGRIVREEGELVLKVDLIRHILPKS
ncbi:MAG: hypothetical protein JXA95_04410 [Spirochaetales bacterium]|nr:hypothetical protein [Spirochaetales bacterium]